MNTDPAVVSLVRGVALFKELTDEELRQMIALGLERSFETGDEVIHERDRALDFFLIIDGSAAVTARGRELGRLGPAQWFGEASLVAGEERHATVTALTALRTLVWTGPTLRQTLARHPSAINDMRDEVRRRFREAHEPD